MKRTIPFAGLLADLPDLGNPGMTQADNCVWSDGTYKPLLSLSVSGDALTARCQGAFAGRDADGNTVLYAGDATKLYQRAGSSWTDKSGATYTTQSIQYWKFRQFGSLVIATNFADTPQKITIGGVGTYSDLTGAPNAYHIGVINNFVVLGNTEDATDGHVPYRVRWSAIGDAEDWPTLGTTDASDKQSDKEDLNSNYGRVQAITDGDQYGLVFQETGITRFTYVGGTAIFEVDTFERARGLYGPFSYAQVGNEVIFLARNGFYRTDGVNVESIGIGSVDSLVLDSIDTNYPERVTTSIDFSNKLIYFSYPDTSATSGTPNKLVIYNYVENKWTTGSETVELVFSSKSLGYTLDELDSVSASIDDLPASLDSPVWTGGNPLSGGFDTAHKLGSFNGSAKTATLDTSEASLNAGGLAYVDGVRPLVEGGTATVALLTRNLQSDSQTAGSATSLNSRTGLADFRSTARYHAARISIAGGFTNAFGADFVFYPAGEV